MLQGTDSWNCLSEAMMEYFPVMKMGKSSSERRNNRGRRL